MITRYSTEAMDFQGILWRHRDIMFPFVNYCLELPTCDVLNRRHLCLPSNETVICAMRLVVELGRVNKLRL
jgi:hypothetical protein